MTSAAYDCDVLLVGYGPTGATLAGLLGQLGVSTMVVDQAAGVFPLPRAAHFDDEVMRIFQGLGAAPRLEPATRVSPAYEFRNGKGDTLLFFDMKGVITSAGWAWGYMIHQPAVEEELRRIAEAQPSVTARKGVKFDRLAQDGEGVTAHLSGPAGPLAVRARYLVGCDGAWSPVREACGIQFLDLGFDEPWLVIDAAVSDDVALPSHNLQICDPERPTTCVLMGPGRHRWEFMLKQGETPEQVLDDAFIQAMLEPWGCAGRVQIERKAVYRFHALVADRWRDRRVMAAGDAAHQMPPFAGQGMCAGIRDAANLAWKLAAVCAGEADQALLDSYQAEREPHVRAVVQTAIAMGWMVCELDPMAAAARDSDLMARHAAGEPPVSIRYPDLSGGCFTETPMAGALMPQPVIGGRRLDDVIGGGWVLIAQPDAALPGGVETGVTAIAATSDRLGPFAPSLQGWLQDAKVSAVLLRPDRHIFGVGEAASLLAARRACLGHLDEAQVQ